MILKMPSTLPNIVLLCSQNTSIFSNLQYCISFFFSSPSYYVWGTLVIAQIFDFRFLRIYTSWGLVNPNNTKLAWCPGVRYSGCKRYWPSKVVLAVISIYGYSSCTSLICSFFKEEIRVATPISMETREGSNPNSDLD